MLSGVRAGERWGATALPNTAPFSLRPASEIFIDPSFVWSTNSIDNLSAGANDNHANDDGGLS